jgi:gluconolactonase
MRASLLSIGFLLGVAAPAFGGILPPGATPVKLAGPFIFTEGPLYDGNGGVYFSDLNSDHVNSHIYRYDFAAHTTLLVDSQSGGANGTYFNASHQIVTADRDREQVSLRSAANVASVQSVVTSSYNGTLYNGPNDLVIDSAGGIYFTDPDYEGRRKMDEALYYVSPQGVVSRLASFTLFTSHPNGVVLSPDQKTLYLALEGAKKIMAYDVATPGTLTNARTLASNVGTTNGPDGLTIDPAGNLYAAGQNNVIAWDPQGAQLFTLSYPEDPTNLEFGGAAGNILYVTAGKSLYSVQLNVPEPATLAMSVLPVMGLAAGRRRIGKGRATKCAAVSGLMR